MDCFKNLGSFEKNRRCIFRRYLPTFKSDNKRSSCFSIPLHKVHIGWTIYSQADEHNGINGDISVQCVGCQECGEGYYGAFKGAYICEICPPGRFNANKGQQKCMLCSHGKYSGMGATTCTECPTGTYSSVDGAGHNLNKEKNLHVPSLISKEHVVSRLKVSDNKWDMLLWLKMV